MRRIVLGLLAGTSLLGFASVASAADLARPVYKAPPPPPPIIYSWTGFYVGGHLGAGWARSERSRNAHCANGFGVLCDFGTDDEPAGNLGSHNAIGVLGGFQAGYNYQINNVVFGVEGQFSFADLKGDSSNSLSRDFASTFSCGFLNLFDCSEFSHTNVESRLSTKIKDIATLAARFGITSGPQDRTLWYVKGGLAWARSDFAASIHGSRTDCITVILNSACSSDSFDGSVSGSNSRWGWMVGTGIEFGLIDNWSTKIEYNYLNFSNTTATLTGTGCFANGDCGSISRDFDIKQNIHVIKIGLNYRFGWGAPVVANY
jgi:outer membrane immunogenic protein